MSRHQSIRETLNDLVMRELHLDRGLTDDDIASQLDSMQRLCLVVAIEDHYQICFEPEEDETIETIEEVIALITMKLDEQEATIEPPA
jgi:acyl carrier protein